MVSDGGKFIQLAVGNILTSSQHSMRATLNHFVLRRWYATNALVRLVLLYCEGKQRRKWAPSVQVVVFGGFSLGCSSEKGHCLLGQWMHQFTQYYVWMLIYTYVYTYIYTYNSWNSFYRTSSPFSITSRRELRYVWCSRISDDWAHANIDRIYIKW